MPELPEVETVRLGLNRYALQRTISDVVFDWPKGFPNAPSDVERFLKGAHFVSIDRKGKVLIFELSSGYELVVHLKMTGQLVFVGNSTGAKKQERFGAGHPNVSLVATLPDTSTRVHIIFSDGSRLFFNDQRKFGWMKLLPEGTHKTLDFFQKLGPEPLSPECTGEVFRQRFSQVKSRNIKAALLDQSIIAGVGNIYADESLWAAGIHPRTLAREIQPDQFDTLYHALKGVLELAIKKGGSTDKNYVNAEGKRGSYLSFANVFRREGQPCNTCGTIIEKIRVAGRGTHVCPRCQPEHA